MFSAHLRRRLAAARGPKRAQALVELVLVMPVMLGMVAVLFQFGILFISYLTVVHTTRDIGRWLSVHPDALDGAKSDCLAPNVAPFYDTSPNAPANRKTLYRRMCDDTAGVIDYKNVTITIIPGTTTTPAGPARTCAVSVPCTNRPTGAEVRLSVQYDAQSSVFLPSSFHFGPFFNVDVKTLLPAYEYSVMVEPH